MKRGHEREFLIDNPLVRIHFIIVMIRWTGLAPWQFEFPFPGSLTSTFLGKWLKFLVGINQAAAWHRSADALRDTIRT